jgi:hypothetical protein
MALRALDLARRFKHKSWLARRKVVDSVVAARDSAHRAIDSRRPPVWSRGDYGGTFLDRDVIPPTLDSHQLPRRVFVLWTGDNELTPNRRAALDEMRARQSVEVVLVTPENISEWWIATHPPHPAYENLSLVHRSDYLRSYLLHHHGGAYCDIKRGYGPLADCITRLEQSPDHWLMGYPELGSRHVAAVEGELGRALRRHHGVLVGNGAFVARPSTQLTAEWLAEVERRLDEHAHELSRHPGTTWGDNPGYPIPWGDLLGAVLQPLTLKHREHVLPDGRLLPTLTDFR